MEKLAALRVSPTGPMLTVEFKELDKPTQRPYGGCGQEPEHAGQGKAAGQDHHQHLRRLRQVVKEHHTTQQEQLRPELKQLQTAIVVVGPLILAALSLVIALTKKGVVGSCSMWP